MYVYVYTIMYQLFCPIRNLYGEYIHTLLNVSYGYIVLSQLTKHFKYENLLMDLKHLQVSTTVLPISEDRSHA